MKCGKGFVVAAAVFLVLPTTIAFGADVGVIGDLNVAAKLGVGTPTPISYPLKLDNQDPTISGATEGAMTGILFSTGGSGAGRGKGALVYETTKTWNRGSFHFLQEPSPNMLNPTITNAVLTISNDGNIGIGNTTPGVKLDVNGWIRAKTGSGDSISIGGDNVGGDVEIQISAPAGRNKISLWNSQL